VAIGDEGVVDDLMDLGHDDALREAELIVRPRSDAVMHYPVPERPVVRTPPVAAYDDEINLHPGHRSLVDDIDEIGGYPFNARTFRERLVAERRRRSIMKSEDARLLLDSPPPPLEHFDPSNPYGPPRERSALDRRIMERLEGPPKAEE